MWPGLVGKGPDSEPPIDLDTMLDLTAAAEVDGVKFDGVDLFLFDPHIDIDSDRRRAEAARRSNPRAQIWSSARWSRRCGRPTGGGSAMGSDEERKQLPHAGAQGLRDRQEAARARHPPVRRHPHRLGGEPGRLGRRIPPATPKRIAETFREACDIAEELRRAARRRRRDLLGRHAQLEAHGRAARAGRTARRRSAFRPTWRTRCSTRWATTRRRIGCCRRTSTGQIGRRSTTRSKTMTDALRPWTIDFHVAQNDATVNGSGSHDKTGRHCLPNDPNGKLDIVAIAGYWLRDDDGTADARLRAHLLGRLHVPERHDDAARRPGATSRDDDRGAQRARLGELSSRERDVRMTKASEYRPGRLRLHGPHPLERVPAGAALFRSAVPAGAEGGVRAQCRRAQSVRRRTGATSRSRPTGASWSSARTSTSSTSPARTTRTPRSRSPPRRPARWCCARSRSAATRAEAQAHGATRSRRPASPNMVWYNYRRVPAVTLAQAADRRGPARPHLPLPREVSAGLDDLAGSAAGRRGAVAAGCRRSPAAA